jgi:hypothetical protein
MKILLINSNPVVSRLTALSARKEDIQIDEIQEVTELSNDNYDIVFVDADSWNKDVSDIIFENIKTQKKVLFYAQDDKEEQGVFDMSILKPFLPSEVSAVIRSIEESISVSEPTESTKEIHSDILKNTKEDKKNDFLLTLDDDLLSDKVEKKSPKELINVKDDLFDDLPLLEGKELDEKDFDKRLEEAFPLKKEDFDNEFLKDIKNEKSSDLRKEEALFELDLNDDTALEKELFTTDNKNDLKINQNNLLDFNLDESHEFDFSVELSDTKIADLKEDNLIKESLIIDKSLDSTTEKEKEKNEMVMKKEQEPAIKTKVLDEIEVANIKDILENDNSPELELSDLMTVSAPLIVESSKEETLENNTSKEELKNKKNKKLETSEVQSNALIETLSALPLDTLKGLLSGATIKIQIKFPKVK